ncbi:VOC family protein [Chitinophaga agrisoli]|uniref:VOC family protein n=1 Tax=Chitinophaga agrisoli TaxID=2607653 RepID=A0A5B2VL51_9BACT|nr:VOC family protein [Chitinophaga agrisoli]KAA2239438.1 VOC family protein [Chitinophaga agrisoli]
MSKISPFLLLIGKAEEAAKFYTSVFKNSKIVSGMPGPDGSPMGFTFQLEDLEFIILNIGPTYEFTPAISFFVKCKTQEEVNDLWEKLTTNGGEESMCGWLVDKYGVSWQIVPDGLVEMFGDADREKAGRAMNAMMKMRKLDINIVRDAFNGK